MQLTKYVSNIYRVLRHWYFITKLHFNENFFCVFVFCPNLKSYLNLDFIKAPVMTSKSASANNLLGFFLVSCQRKYFEK